MTLMQREMADDNRHLRSMEAFINHVQGKPVMIADAEQGYIIQQLVAALYQSAETGTRVEIMAGPVTLSEPHFSQHTLNKYASLMAQGNGYLGLRASHEEDYTRQTRGMYLAGLYHRAGKGEINELVNLPDVVGMEIAINGEVFVIPRSPAA